MLRNFIPGDSRILISKNELGQRINQYVGEVLTTFELVDLNTGSITRLSKIQSDADFTFGVSGSKAATRIKSARPKTDGPEPWLEFLSSSNVAPPKEVLRSLAPEEVTGRMVYVASVPLSGTGDNTQWGTFIVLRRFGKGANAVQSFRVEARDSDVLLPQWSPNGQFVLLGVGGAGNATDTYLIHLWNIQTGRVEQGPKEYVSYLNPRWSPDSKRIAYIVGGDIEGENQFLARTPTSLRVYDVATGKSYVLKTAPSGPQVSLAQFQWQNANSLLYAYYVLPTSVTQAKGEAARKRAAATLKPEDIRPSIFQVAATGGASTLVVKDGFRPMPSPDGRWIAFFGWPDVKEAQDEAKINPQSRYYGPRLFVWDRQVKRRFLVSPNIFLSNVQMKWTPDSHKLVLLQSSYNSQKTQGTAHISTIAVDGR